MRPQDHVACADLVPLDLVRMAEARSMHSLKMVVLGFFSGLAGTLYVNALALKERGPVATVAHVEVDLMGKLFLVAPVDVLGARL